MEYNAFTQTIGYGSNPHLRIRIRDMGGIDYQKMQDKRGKTAFRKISFTGAGS